MNGNVVTQENPGAAARQAPAMPAWRGLALMLFARTALAVAAQGMAAIVYAMHGSATPWRDAEAWLPVYGTLIDVGCLGLLWWLTRREGIALVDLIGFGRGRLWRDVLLS